MRSDPLAYLAAELETLKAQGLYRRLRVLEGEQKAKTTVDHRVVVNLSSNNYLGLTTHPRLRERAIEANPVISAAMALGGVVAGVASAKAIAIGFGIMLHLRRVHNLVAALTAIYFTAAILPWAALFLTR